MQNAFRRNWNKLIKGSTDSRPTRFHTQDGHLAPGRAFLDLPAAVIQWLRLKLTGHRVERPWIPPAATRELQTRLSPEARVLEIGAGMSTLWLAARSRSVLSIEADRQWFELLGTILAERHLRQVDLQFRWRKDDMCDFSAIPDGSLDLCFIDGGPRIDCLQAALPKMKPDGWIYVDNTDLYLETKQFITALPQQRPCRVAFYRGFAPACLFVNEGAIVRFGP